MHAVDQKLLLIRSISNTYLQIKSSFHNQQQGFTPPTINSAINNNKLIINQQIKSSRTANHHPAATN